jgi:hypothetical protein
MLEKWISKKVNNFLENNINEIFYGISDETIKILFDKSRDFIIEARHLKEEVTALKNENEDLKIKLDTILKN